MVKVTFSSVKFYNADYESVIKNAKFTKDIFYMMVYDKILAKKPSDIINLS